MGRTGLICLALADSPRLAPLLLGDCVVDGIRLSILRGQRPQILNAALADPQLSGGEASLAAHLRRLDVGDRSFVALPIFVNRSFVARYAFVRGKRPRPELLFQLEARVSLYGWAATGAIWFRHFLRDIGAPYESYAWYVGPYDVGEPFLRDASVPPSALSAPVGTSLVEMLLGDDIDILVSAERLSIDRGEGHISRCFEDIVEVESAYFRRTSIFPPQHCIILRREAWNECAAVAGSLVKAFNEMEVLYEDNQRRNPFSAPWHEMQLEKAVNVLGRSGYLHGIKANRLAINTLAEEAYRNNIVKKPLTSDDIFKEYLEVSHFI